MESFLPIFFLVVVLVGLLIGLGIYQNQQRKKFWWQLAEEWGFRYHPNGPDSICEGHEFHLFQEGHSQRVEQSIEGIDRGRPMVLFDYTYKTGSGKSETTHQLSALMVKAPLFGCRLTVRPENFFDRVAGFFGFDDINFEFEDFNRAFQVRCTDKKFAYDVFHNQMMEFMMQHCSIALEWCDYYLLFYSYNQGRFGKSEAEAMREVARGFIERVPEYLIRQEREG